MHPSTRNTTGAIALLASALLGLMACNQATEPYYSNNSGSATSMGSGGDNSTSGNSGITRALLGGWRQTDVKGNELGWGDTTSFDVRGGYFYKRHPPASKLKFFREDKGVYSTSGDSLFVTVTSARESSDGKTWTDIPPWSGIFTFVVEGNKLILSDGVSLYHFTR